MPWTTEQVVALAPDARSVPAARKLRSWPETGFDERAVWGLCQGSGRTPYEVVVDLDGPAYRCSCPSHKFPCKHALGLLIRWSEGQVQAGARPQFAAEWLQQREQRAARRPPREQPPDPEAQARRAEQREARIDAGMWSSSAGCATSCAAAWPRRRRSRTPSGSPWPPGWWTRKRRAPRRACAG